MTHTIEELSGFARKGVPTDEDTRQMVEYFRPLVWCQKNQTDAAVLKRIRDIDKHGVSLEGYLWV